MADSEQPVVIDGRFVLEPESPRVGGTAHVYRARDFKAQGAEVALKLYDGTAIDDELRLECFLRERAALEALSHPNVVQLISAGYDNLRSQHYLVLEWLPETLVGRLQREGDQVKWPVLAREVLRPILQGLAAAHARRVMHRDIKPANVMVAGDGTVKLTDFGVAKLLDSIRFGMTVRELHSRPYAAPERDTGEVDARSDLYSLGVTMIDLLASLERRLAKDVLPLNVLNEIDVPDDARYFLESLVAPDVDERPFNAKLALSELDRLLVWEPIASDAPRRKLRIALTNAALGQGRAALGPVAEQEVRRRLIEDLSSEPPTIARDRRAGNDWGEEAAIRLDVVGQELLYSAHFDREGTGTLVIVGVRAVPPSLLERRRDDGLEVRHQLVFDGRWPNQREDADALIDDLATYTVAATQARLERAELELFERWRSVLEAKTELESRREDPIPYTSVRRESGLLSFTVTRDVDESYLDQPRRARMAGGAAVVGSVVEVGDHELGLAVERGNVDALPDHGQLLSDRQASRRAIDRQRRALADVRDGDGARSDLGELLVHPERAASLRPMPLEGFLQELDEPKQRAVETALASPDFTLVEGPPGTGKTTFIVELIAQVLAGRPASRILLSSQTHVAVDNAALKLGSLDVLRGVRIVRVGAVEKVDADAQHLTVPEQIRRWHAEARVAAQDWLAQRGRERGISAQALLAYTTADELSAANDAVVRCQMRMAELAAEELRLLELLTDPTRPAPSSTTTGEMVADEEDELAAVQDEIETRARELENLRDEKARLIAVLGSCLESESVPEPEGLEAALRARYPVKDDDLAAHRALAKLQDEWLVRFGQGDDFTEALLSSAQVVAGTCVGLAGALDDQEPFDLAIVDEVSKATPTEALVPMARSRRWVLVGDEQQLPPYVDGELVDQGLLDGYGLSRQDLEETLFSQLGGGLPQDRQVTLSVQHRMLEPIGNLVSECFYGGKLRSSRPSKSSRTSLTEAFPCPVVWYSTSRQSGRRERRVGTTYWNEAELRTVRMLLARLQRRAAENDEQLRVAVISGYGEQARRIHRDLRPHEAKWTHLAIDVHPVDSFQGQQRHVVIYSVTRSNADNELGFLRSERRINVALSRAEDALLIVGDARFCARARDGDNPFANVLDHIRQHPGCRLEEPQR